MNACNIVNNVSGITIPNIFYLNWGLAQATKFWNAAEPVGQ